MKNVTFAIAFLMVVSLPPLTTGCGSAPAPVAQAPDTRDDDEAAIAAASKDWRDAQAAKDLPKCVSFYADDGEILPPGYPLVTGKEDLRKEWEKILAMPGTWRWSASKIEVARSSDIAYETGAYELTTTDAKKQPVISTGKYILVWTKQDDGKWKIAEDIENADK